jgi:hypothetical protein
VTTRPGAPGVACRGERGGSAAGQPVDLASESPSEPVRGGVGEPAGRAVGGELTCRRRW